MWSVISGGEGFAVGERGRQDGGRLRGGLGGLGGSGGRWLIDTYQPAADALHIKGAEACGHGAPLLGCHTGSGDSKGRTHTGAHTCTHAHAHAQLYYKDTISACS